MRLPYPYENYLMHYIRYYGGHWFADAGPRGILPSWLVNEANEFNSLRDILRISYHYDPISMNKLNLMLDYANKETPDDINANLYKTIILTKTDIKSLCTDIFNSPDLWVNRSLNKKGIQAFRQGYKTIIDKNYAYVTPIIQWREEQEKKQFPDVFTITEMLVLLTDFAKESKSLTCKPMNYYFDIRWEDELATYRLNKDSFDICFSEHCKSIKIDRITGNIVVSLQ